MIIILILEDANVANANVSMSYPKAILAVTNVSCFLLVQKGYISSL